MDWREQVMEQKWRNRKKREFDKYVYFISGAGLIKIGSSEYPEFRLEELQRHSPVHLCLLAKCKGGSKLEAELHKRFVSDRCRGEWFAPSKELQEIIDQC